MGDDSARVAPADPNPRPRIAIVHQGDPGDPGAWSGVPAGLASGLEQCGCEPIRVDARFPHAGRIAGRLGMSWAAQSASRPLAAASSVAATRRLRAQPDLDGAVMVGSGYSLSSALPVATFDDMTVALARRRGDPVYAALGEPAARRWQDRQRRNFERSRACCVASHWAAASVREDYGIPAGKVHVVGFGNRARRELVERDWSVPRFLWVGFDWERKRGPAVLEAFAAVRERHPDATLDLVGGHPPVEADGVTPHGKLPLGSEEGQRKYNDLIRRSTCFLMPSTYEPLGIAYLDAAASGLPSIGTTVGGAEDAVDGGGLVVDPGDPGGLRAAMLELSDPETARSLSERAFERSALYTWRAVAERVLRALRPRGVDVDGLADFIPPAGARAVRA
jgi:glycosyltransferase involved in cell wall biosynthesis